MRYVVNVRAEAWASVILLPPDVVDCVEQRLQALHEDPADLAMPFTDADLAQVAGADVLQYDFQCEPLFFSAFFVVDEGAGAVHVVHLHQHPDRP